MEKLKREIKRRIDRNQIKIDIIKDRHGDKPSENFTYFGGWDLGYFEGSNSALSEVLDKIEGID